MSVEAISAPDVSTGVLQSHREGHWPPIVGQSQVIRSALELVRCVATSDANILIHGESGTGKELFANAAHRWSRHGRPFVKVNCAAIPEDLVESELFGYRKGAFTGATGDKAGIFEQAAGGSLLLDEIGEMPPLLQTKLLRVLQEREFRPLGGRGEIKVNFRLICTTNVDVLGALASRRLREDLYFRINTVSVRVPPLRDRGSDIALLAEHFFEKYRRRHGRLVRGLSPATHETLLRYHWPGNVRELESAIECGVLLAKDAHVSADDLPEMVRAPTHASARGLGGPSSERTSSGSAHSATTTA